MYMMILLKVIQGNTYKILNLYVGKMINNIEIPTLFRKENLHIAKVII